MAKKSSAILNKIMEFSEQFAVNALKYDKTGNKSAARRARKASSELNRLFKEYRKLTIEETR